MNRKTIPFIAVVALAAWAVFASCTDNDYDLSDVDTNARFTVKDLVIPVNLDDIQLDPVLDLNDDSKIKKNGDEYAVIEEGEFSSDPIMVHQFTTNGDHFESSKGITLQTIAPVGKRAPGDGKLAFAPIPSNATYIRTSANNIDKSIITVDRIGTDMDINISLQFGGLTNYIDQIAIEGLVIQYLTGLEMTPSIGTYDPESGLLTIGDTQTTTDHKFEIGLHITGIDREQAGVIFENSYFSIDKEVYVKSGELALYADQIKPGIIALPTEEINYTLSADIGACKVTTFTGVIQYNITDINIDPIDMSDIPEVLSQEGTDIVLQNPQIYLNVNNPLYNQYQVFAQTGLSLKGNATYSIANDAVKLDQPIKSFVLAPDVQNVKYKVFEGLNVEGVTFSDLGKVLSGGKFPNQIEIELLSPMIPQQQVTNFDLGDAIPAVKGKWQLYAPLNLAESSIIKYTKKWDDWQDDDLDGLTVENAVVTASMSSDVPLALDVTFTLLGREGKLSGSTKLSANANDEKIEIPLTGTAVSKIYGLEIDAKIKGSGKSISPSQKVTVKNLKAKVNGHYDKEL